MAAFIGVSASLAPDLGALKRNLILFDRLQVIGFAQQRYLLRRDPDLLAQYDHFVENGLVLPATDPTPEWRGEWRLGPRQREMIRFFDAIQQRRLTFAWNNRRALGAEQASQALDDLKSQVLARLVALEWRSQGTADAVVLPSSLADYCAPVLFGDGAITEGLAEEFPLLAGLLEPAPKDEVAEVVLGRFPIPHDSTPWEDIVLFRSDPDSGRKFRGLKVWLNEVATGSRSKAELQDLVDHNLEEYRQHLRLHRIRHSPGIVRLLLTVPAAFLEELVRLRFTKLLDVVFLATERRASLMEAEASAPGRELAYLVKAQDRFRDLVQNPFRRLFRGA